MESENYASNFLTEGLSQTVRFRKYEVALGRERQPEGPAEVSLG